MLSGGIGLRWFRIGAEMGNALLLKLGSFARLSPEDASALENVTRQGVRALQPREDIVREGERSNYLILILSGWAIRYKALENGRRQIIGILLPGDVCDLNVFLLHRMDHSLGTLTAASICEVDRGTWDAIAHGHPGIVHALERDALVTSAIHRRWILNLGQRSALQRVAHLQCEILHRLRFVGLADQEGCEFPMTQTDLADACGLSAVHVNRTLQELRAAGLITLHGRRLSVPDLSALQRTALFNPDYLHLDRSVREPNESAAAPVTVEAPPEPLLRVEPVS